MGFLCGFLSGFFCQPCLQPLQLQLIQPAPAPTLQVKGGVLHHPGVFIIFTQPKSIYHKRLFIFFIFYTYLHFCLLHAMARRHESWKQIRICGKKFLRLVFAMLTRSGYNCLHCNFLLYSGAKESQQRPPRVQVFITGVSKKPMFWISIDFNADPDPAFVINADPGFQEAKPMRIRNRHLVTL